MVMSSSCGPIHAALAAPAVLASRVDTVTIRRVIADLACLTSHCRWMHLTGAAYEGLHGEDGRVVRIVTSKRLAHVEREHRGGCKRVAAAALALITGMQPYDLTLDASGKPRGQT